MDDMKSEAVAACDVLQAQHGGSMAGDDVPGTRESTCCRRGGAFSALMPPVRTRSMSHDGLCVWQRSAADFTCSASGVCQEQDPCLSGCYNIPFLFGVPAALQT